MIVNDTLETTGFGFQPQAGPVLLERSQGRQDGRAAKLTGAGLAFVRVPLIAAPACRAIRWMARKEALKPQRQEVGFGSDHRRLPIRSVEFLPSLSCSLMDVQLLLDRILFACRKGG